MGTLFNQSPRQERNSYFYNVMDIATKLFNQEQELSAEHYKAASAVFEAGLKMQSADTLDEQLGGFGELIIRAIEAYEDRTAAYRERTEVLKDRE